MSRLSRILRAGLSIHQKTRFPGGRTDRGSSSKVRPASRTLGDKAESTTVVLKGPVRRPGAGKIGTALLTRVNIIVTRGHTVEKSDLTFISVF